MKRKVEGQIYARYLLKDIVIPIEDSLSDSDIINLNSAWIIGYEDEYGNECEKDGTYLNQENNDWYRKVFCRIDRKV